MTNSRIVFMTGASGYIGGNLLREMLRTNDNSEFYLLTRSQKTRDSLKYRFQGQESRVHFINGDLTVPELGISDPEQELLGERVNEIWHLAASTDFQEEKRKEITAMNIGGTRNMLDVAKKLKRLSKFFYMSTAYIAGKTHGQVPEDVFVHSNGFKNPYEETKYDADHLIRQMGLPLIVVRPSILIGNSKTLEVGGDAKMFYGYAEMIQAGIKHHFGGEEGFKNYWLNVDPKNPREIPVRLVGFPETTKNVVCLDDVVNSCLAVWDNGKIGETYNLVSPTNITMAQAAEGIQRALRIRGLSMSPELVQGMRGASSIERVTAKFTSIYHPYTTIPEPDWQHDKTDALNPERVRMNPELFEGLMRKFIERKMMPESKAA